MSRFLNKQLTSAESKPLGKTEGYYRFNADGSGGYSQRRADAAKKPPLVMQHMTPVGRTSGVCKPGAEADGERAQAPEYGTFPAAITRPSKRRKRP
jgi:hypothetical protein